MAANFLKILLIASITISFFVRVQADVGDIAKELYVRKDLQQLVIDLINGLVKKNDVTCLTIICDELYLNVFDGVLFRRIFAVPYVMIVVAEYEDLLAPNYDTLESLRQAKTEGCNVYVIIMANGDQVTRLLRFGDRYRVLNMRARFIMLHDIRLFHSSLHYIWKRIINVLFLKYHKKVVGKEKSRAWFDLTTVPYPASIKGIFISRRVDIWNGKFQYRRDLFAEKAENFSGEELNVVYYGHLPSVVVLEFNGTDKVGGVEVEILNTLASKMNFKPNLYKANNAKIAKWGEEQDNGTFTGLLGEVVNGKADVALGNLQYTSYHYELTDLSTPYTFQCWTFLTPEALTDNSWKTLILPFNLYMWVAVLMVLLVTGSIFYGLAIFYINLLNYNPSNFKNKEKEVYTDDAKPVGLYLFGEITNSILYTYGMLLVVSLPKLPSGWSIRLLTGWYWLYCILLVVSYRASMTAILAKPIPRVTIDTLKELVNSKISCGGWGTQAKQFFTGALDDDGKIIADKFVNVKNPDEAAEQIAKGVFAYYDSSDFLKYLSAKRKSKMNLHNNALNHQNRHKGDRNLHIMSDCVVNVPISIGFHKNSPLKPLSDVYIRRIIEVGLVEKWLNDAMYKIRSMDKTEIEVQALINLKKLYCAFVALAIGYSISLLCLIGEYIHWNYIVKNDPSFDKYAVDIYYMNKNKKALHI